MKLDKRIAKEIMFAGEGEKLAKQDIKEGDKANLYHRK